MTRQRFFIFSAALLAVAVIIYLIIPKEPRYEGRSLSSWTSKDLNSYRSVPGSAQWEAASNAICAMGTNALPYLIRWSYAKDSKGRSEIVQWLNSYLPRSFHIRTDGQRQREGHLGLQCLGSLAKQSWPLFVQWTLDTKDADRRRLGVECLMDTKADHQTILPVLHRLFEDPNFDVRETATSAFIELYQRERLYKNFSPVSADKLMPKTFATNQPVAK